MSKYYFSKSESYPNKQHSKMLKVSDNTDLSFVGIDLAGHKIRCSILVVIIRSSDCDYCLIINEKKKLK